MSRSVEASLTPIADKHLSLRFVVLLLAGSTVAMGLTLFMHLLIEASQQELNDAARTHFLDFVRVKRDESSQRKKEKPKRPEQEDVPPTPMTPESDPFDQDFNAVNVSALAVSDQVDVEIGSMQGIAGDGEYLPIVKVAPAYPIKAALNGTEGNCMVEYTVTVTGATRNVRTVSGQCMKVFARVSIAAARKFKYKPRVIDGEAIEVPNIKNLFEFTLDNPNQQ